MSLGKRFCLALAKRDALPAWSTDRAWRDVPAATGVKVVTIR